MAEVSDAAVWTAYGATEAEAKCWRVMSFPGGGAVAIRDQLPMPTPTTTPIGVGACKTTYERFDFRDETQAKDYIRWRVIKAALETLEGNPQ